MEQSTMLFVRSKYDEYGTVSLEIDSCPIEGWNDKNGLDELLKNDRKEKRIALILVLVID